MRQTGPKLCTARPATNKKLYKKGRSPAVVLTKADEQCYQAEVA
mgnify:CR=1 FL=1